MSVTVLSRDERTEPAGADTQSGVPSSSSASWRANVSLSVLAFFMGVVLIASFSPSPRGWLVFPIFVNVVAIVIAIALQRRDTDAGRLSLVDVFAGVVFIQGALVPALDLAFGAPHLGFRFASQDAGALGAAWVATVFNFAVLLTSSLTRHRHKPRPVHEHVRKSAVNYYWTLVGLGSIGLVLRAPHDLSALRQPEWLIGERPQQLVGLLSTWLVPLLFVGTALLILEGRPHIAVGRRGVQAALVLVSGVALLSFSLNRAALLVPILALFMMSMRRDKPMRARSVGIVLAALAVALVVLGQFRTQVQFEAQDLKPTGPGGVDYAATSLRLYFQSPYLVGIVFDDHSIKFDASSLTASAMSPVPILGRDFRASSGTTKYNMEVYGGSLAMDQIMPVSAEIQRSLGLGGLLIAGVFFGALLRRLSDKAKQSETLVRSYATTFCGLWLCQAPIVSVSVLSQVAFYFMLPVCLAAALAPIGVSTQAFKRAQA